jgi:hypothetical protein
MMAQFCINSYWVHWMVDVYEYINKLWYSFVHFRIGGHSVYWIVYVYEYNKIIGGTILYRRYDFLDLGSR